jgi:PAS domain-containing protein
MCRRERANRLVLVSNGSCRIEHIREQRAVAFRRQFEERFQALAQRAFDAAFECAVGETGGEVAEALSGALRSLMGLSPNDQDGPGWEPLVHPDDHAVVAAHLQCVLEGRRDLCVFRVVMPVETVRWFGVLTRTVQEVSSRRVAYVYGLVRDYTAHTPYQAVDRALYTCLPMICPTSH